MEEITETAAPAIINEAGNVIEAVSQGNMDISVFKNFTNAVVAYLPTVAAAIAIYIAGKIIAKILLKIADKAMGRSRIDPTAQGFLRSLTNITPTAFVIIIALSALGIPMTSIITAIGAAGLAVGLALQSCLSNVAGGFLILLTKPFSKGDYICTNGIEGVVDEISILSTKLLTLDNKVVFIPNGSVSSSTLTNFSKEPKRRVDLKFSIGYKEDSKKAIKLITDIAASHELVLKDGADAPFARVSDLSASSVDITVRVWTKTADYWTVYFDMIEKIKAAFDSNGIEIPYSKLDVRIRETK